MFTQVLTCLMGHLDTLWGVFLNQKAVHQIRKRSHRASSAEDESFRPPVDDDDEEASGDEEDADIDDEDPSSACPWFGSLRFLFYHRTTVRMITFC